MIRTLTYWSHGRRQGGSEERRLQWSVMRAGEKEAEEKRREEKRREEQSRGEERREEQNRADPRRGEERRGEETTGEKRQEEKQKKDEVEEEEKEETKTEFQVYSVMWAVHIILKKCIALICHVSHKMSQAGYEMFLPRLFAWVVSGG